MLLQLLPAAILAGQTFAGPVKLRSIPTTLTPAAALVPRADGDITTFIALGESYATGVGAGKADKSVLKTRCLRYDQAYPRVLARDSEIPGTADETRLTNNACSGQTIQQILDTQFGDEDKGDFKAFGKPQFATISAAGDDIEFKELVLSCIYEFPYKPRKCQEQIDRSKDLLNAPEFTDSIKKLISTTFDKGLANHPDFRIYFTGYGQFFNTRETNPDFCSEKTWSLCKFWQRGCEKLPVTVDLRTKLNELAQILNTRIQESIDSFKDTKKDGNGNPLVKFVDIDDIVQDHRYCEQGKEEPVKNDDDIWFFQWLDDETNNDDGKHQFYNQVANMSSLANIETLQDDSLGGTFTIGVEDFLQNEIDVANANVDLANEIDAEGSITNRVKTFHPKIQFHAKIEERLRDMVKADYAAATSNTNPTSSQPLCQGNQVQGDCQANTLPIVPPFSGPQAPSCAKADGSPGAQARINEQKLADTAAEYCNNLINGKVVLSADNGGPKPGTVANAAEGGKTLVLTTLYDQDSCPTDKSSSTLDFAAYGLQKCVDAFSTILAEVCAQDSTWTNFNKDFTVMGGIWATDCGLFSVQTQ